MIAVQPNLWNLVMILKELLSWLFPTLIELPKWFENDNEIPNSVAGSVVQICHMVFCNKFVA